MTLKNAEIVARISGNNPSLMRNISEGGLMTFRVIAKRPSMSLGSDSSVDVEDVN